MIFALLFFSKLTAQEQLSQPLTVEFEQESIGEILIRLSEAADVNISFSPDLFGTNTQQSISAQQESLSSILDRLLSGTKVGYKFDNSGIVLFRSKPSRYVISGYLTDANTGERLIGAHIFDVKTREGCSSNAYGFFSHAFPEGNLDLCATYLGYDEKRLSIRLEKDQALELSLHSDLTLEEVVVTDRQYASHSISETGHLLNIESLSGQPKMAGEADLIRSLQLQNGVASSQDGLAGLHVRGGNSDQNLLLLDDIPVFNGAHSFGLFSIYNPDIVRSIRVYKEAFPARYDGRLSSVIDVHTKEGNTNKHSGSISTGTLLTKAHLEFPILGRKGAVVLAGRHTNLNLWLGPYASSRKEQLDYDSGSMQYLFADLNLKAHYSINNRNKLYLSHYWGKDSFQDYGAQSYELDLGPEIEDPFFEEYFPSESLKFRADDSTSIEWGNSITAVRWNHLFNDRLFVNNTLTYSRFRYNFEHSHISGSQDQSDLNFFTAQQSQSSFSTDVSDLALRSDFTYYMDHQNEIQFGASLMKRKFVPGISKSTFTFTLPAEFFETEYSFEDSLHTNEAFVDSQERQQQEMNTYEAVAYLEDAFTYGPWRLELGLRGSFYMVDNWTSVVPMPKLGLAYTINDRTAVKMSISNRTQFVHLLTDSDAGLPNDVWVPAVRKAPPQRSTMVHLGAYRSLNKYWTCTAEAYWKSMNQLIRLQETEQPGSDLPGYDGSVQSYNLSALGWENAVYSGSGRSSGLELMLRQSREKFSTSLGYSLSKTTRTFRGYTEAAAFDARHSIALTTQLQVNNIIRLSAAWSYESGRPNQLINYSESSLPYTSLLDQEQGMLSGDRFPAYHRLDLSLQASFGNKVKGHVELGAYNAYDRKNVFFQNIVQTEQGARAQTVYSLPFIPSLSLKLEW